MINAIVDLVKQDDGALKVLMSLPEVKRDTDLSQLSTAEFKQKLTSMQVFKFAYLGLKRLLQFRTFFQGIENLSSDRVIAVFFHQFYWGNQGDIQSFEDMEEMVVEILAAFFQRKIHIIPCCETPPFHLPQTYGEEYFSRTYHLFAIRAELDSVYISAIDQNP